MNQSRSTQRSDPHPPYHDPDVHWHDLDAESGTKADADGEQTVYTEDFEKPFIESSQQVDLRLVA